MLGLPAIAIAVHSGRSTRAADGPPRSGPIEHPKIAFPATLSSERAEAVYQALRRRLRTDYARSGDPAALAYQGWKRFNTAPYRSSHHGRRFVNHYANDLAAAYGMYGVGGPLRVGSVVVKDSFVVSETGLLRTGPFFMMEKMPPDFRSAAGSWRFLMIEPDGDVTGMTGGANAQRVDFCADCHKKAGPERDYLFFPPRGVRLSDPGAAR